jgi:hypothetical protein
MHLSQRCQQQWQKCISRLDGTSSSSGSIDSSVAIVLDRFTEPKLGQRTAESSVSWLQRYYLVACAALIGCAYCLADLLSGF